MALMPAVFDFDRYAELFNDQGAAGAPSEMHGHLVGRLSAGTRLDHTTWLSLATELLDGRNALSEAGKVMLIQLYDATLAQLAGSGFDITLLVPDDSATIDRRTHALGEWCEGFLGGFGLVERDGELTEEADSVLRDFAAIAQVQTDLDESEANEVDFMEVTEYVRMAVLMVFSECQPASDQDQPPASLH
ncbi:MAG TPA: hypothetical protein ENI17_12900 [Pseudomonas xinjiangensis]|uniref:Uncharacterized protein n=2 Tax=root TaxID=1 RepID=A0A7V1BNF1_9GAMM|nr:hypothetical protein [Halopseudomonas xinjiangensis]HEC48509.1 hypothetical protein [Halopseudomonas xinjiangensis]